MTKYGAPLGVLVAGLTLAAVAWGATPIITTAGKNVASIAVSPDGKIVAVSSNDGSNGSGKVQIFNAQDGSLVHNLIWPNGAMYWVYNLAFNADGTILYGRSGNRTLAWNVATGAFVGEFAINPNNGATEGQAVNPSGAAGSGNTAVLVTEGKPGWIEIRDTNNNLIATVQVIRPVDAKNNSSPVDDIAFAPGGFIVTVGKGNYACVTEKKYQNGQSIWTCDLKNPIKLPSQGLRVDISPYGKVVIATAKNSVIVADKNTGKQITLKDSQGYSNCVFLSDGHTVACTSSNGSLRFWNGDTGEVMSTQDTGSLPTSLAAGPNNSVYVGGGGKVRPFQYGSPAPTATPTVSPSTSSSPSPSSSPKPSSSPSPSPTSSTSPSPTPSL